MALTPKEAARLAQMEKIIPIIKPFFDNAKLVFQAATADPPQEMDPGAGPATIDIASVLLLLVVDDLKDEYQSLKARA